MAGVGEQVGTNPAVRGRRTDPAAPGEHADLLSPPVTNGVAEGLNSKILAIKREACGYRNRDHFKTSIYFFCGGLELYPVSS